MLPYHHLASAQKRVILPHLVQIKRIVFDLGVETPASNSFSLQRELFIYHRAHSHRCESCGGEQKGAKRTNWPSRVDI
jgi:hypothetical protein